jgi:hypothetical protein
MKTEGRLGLYLSSITFKFQNLQQKHMEVWEVDSLHYKNVSPSVNMVKVLWTSYSYSSFSAILETGLKVLLSYFS